MLQILAQEREAWQDVKRPLTLLSDSFSWSFKPNVVSSRRSAWDARTFVCALRSTSSNFFLVCLLHAWCVSCKSLLFKIRVEDVWLQFQRSRCQVWVGHKRHDEITLLQRYTPFCYTHFLFLLSETHLFDKTWNLILEPAQECRKVKSHCFHDHVSPNILASLWQASRLELNSCVFTLEEFLDSFLVQHLL